MPAARVIYLVGMMGAGKTTVGRALASKRGAVFVDLDRRIERIFGRTVEAWFAEGEPVFRAREREALASLVQEPSFSQRNVVVATGGGAVLDAANRQAMRGSGVVVYLQVAASALARRLSADASGLLGRPLLLGHAGPEALEAELSARLEAREPYYRDGALVVDADGAPDEVVVRVLAALGEPCE